MAVMMVNPQVCVGYFSVLIRVFDGDTVHRVESRIRRTSGIPGMSRHMHVTCMSCDRCMSRGFFFLFQVVLV